MRPASRTWPSDPANPSASTWLDREHLLVSDFAGGRLMVVDAAHGVITDAIEVGPNPKGIALSPGAHTAFVTNWSGRSVSVVDLDHKRVVQVPDVVEGRGVDPLRIFKIEHEVFF